MAGSAGLFPQRGRIVSAKPEWVAHANCQKLYSVFLSVRRAPPADEHHMLQPRAPLHQLPYEETVVILELVDIRINPGMQAEFDAAIERAVRTVTSRAQGMRGWQVHKCVETPERYVMQIVWDSIEAHMVTYRQSPLSPEFRAIVEPFFAQPPEMKHFELLVQSPGGFPLPAGSSPAAKAMSKE